MKVRLFVASICGLLLVIAGAYMGHGPTTGFPPSADAYTASRLNALEFRESLNSALLFGFAHTFLAMMVGVLQLRSRLVSAAGWSFLVGVILFSGVLCLRNLEQFQNGPDAMSFTEKVILLVPLGGIGFIAGWLMLGIAVLRSTTTSETAPR